MEIKYNLLIKNIGRILEEGRREAIRSVNQILVQTYWEIGKQIVEYEQKGKEKAEYGSKLLDTLSKDLKLRYGKGFSRRNILDMFFFYNVNKIRQTVSPKLSWSYYVELLSVEDNLARNFYEKQCINEKWSVRELRRQKNSLLFERIALSKDKQGVLDLSRKGQLIEKPEDLIKDPYVVEFLKIPENYKYSERDF